MDTPSFNTPKKEQPVGPVVGIVIIVLLLAAGGIYFLLMEQKENEQQGLEEAQASNSEDNLVVSPNAI